MEETLKQIAENLAKPSAADWIMVIITGVYVLATIAICYFNGKSAKASRDQIAEARKQFNESNRPHVIAGIKCEENFFMCRYVKNIGNDVADNIAVNLESKWLALIKDTNIKNALTEITSQQFMLVPGQEIERAFTCMIPGVTDEWLDVFAGVPLIIKITYNKKNSTESYSDSFMYDVKLFRSMYREKSENEKEIKEISKSLKGISSAADKMAANTKSIAGKI